MGASVVHPFFVRRTLKFSSGHKSTASRAQGDVHMNQTNTEQQTQENQKPKKSWKAYAWTCFITLTRILNILVAIVRWLEGDGE